MRGSCRAHPHRALLDGPRVEPFSHSLAGGIFETFRCARGFPRGREKRHARPVLRSSAAEGGRARSPSQTSVFQIKNLR